MYFCFEVEIFFYNLEVLKRVSDLNLELFQKFEKMLKGEFKNLLGVRKCFVIWVSFWLLFVKSFQGFLELSVV